MLRYRDIVLCCHFQWAIWNCTNRYLLLVTCRFPNPPLRKHNLHGIGLRPISAQKGDFAHCDGRPKALPLESASPLEKGLDPKPFVIKSGRICVITFSTNCALQFSEEHFIIHQTIKKSLNFLTLRLFPCANRRNGI